ncbi:lipopolysaccharide biosynthesis protein [Pedobacter deserti]|uniref:lipopolysaccharide biosynthesis protein n=1 Tax=Pedobacter deserti TaxID=2817382 RepID=UPI002109398E|nr:oligosaccharide flippase family protein [Pedobacter sp. SYSU D00382]
MFRKFLKTSIIYAVGPQLPKVAGLFLLPILTPFLTKEDFGIWGTVMAYTLLFSAARDLGMIAPMVNTFYQHPTRWRWVWRQIITFLALFGIAYTFIQLVVIWWIMPGEASGNLYIILVLIAIQSLVLDIPNQIGARFLQLSERPVPLALISMISGFISIGVQMFYVVVLKQGYMAWFYSAFASALFSAVCYLCIMTGNGLKPIPVFRMRLLSARIRLSLPMLPHNYSGYLLNASDRMVMNVSKVSTENIGIYNVAYTWGNYIDIFGNAVGMAVGPMYLKLFSEKTADAENRVYHLTQFLQLIFLFGPFIVALWSRELFSVFIKNKELQAAYGLSIIIIMSYSYRPLYWNVVSRLQYYGHTGQLWKISLVGGLINLVLNLIFIPLLGYQIAAITTFVALMYIGFSGFYLKQYKAHDRNNYGHLIWLILIIACTFVAYLLRDTSVMVKSIITLVLTAATVLYIRKNHFQSLNQS